MVELRREQVIRIIPILAIVLYVLVQMLVVPLWDKELEAAHIDIVYDDMTSLQSDIVDVAQQSTQKSSIVHLGVQYPNRILFFNPGPGAAGSITVEPVWITGSYTTSEACTHPINYNSSRIIYDLNGMINSPKLVYEHGIIIWDWDAQGNVTVYNQSLIYVGTGNVHIPVVNAKPCTTSGLATKIFAIHPYSTTFDCTDAEFVTITLDTDYPAVWRDILSGYVKAGLVSVSNQTKTISISCSALPYISLPDQPAQGAVSAGIITFSKEPPAVLTLPSAIKQNTTAEKNVTSTSTAILTPIVTPRGHDPGSGGGGPRGGGGSCYTKKVVVDKTPKVSTENATNISAVSATLNMSFDFNDYDTVQVRFKYKAGEEIEWNDTGWVSQAGSGSQSYSETLVNLSTNTTYYFLAQLQYDHKLLSGNWSSFTTKVEPRPPKVSTENATNLSDVSPTLNLTFDFNETPPPTTTPTTTPTSTPTLTPAPAPIPRQTPSPTPRSRPGPSIAPRPTTRP
jgi:hypothetical protein